MFRRDTVKPLALAVLFLGCGRSEVLDDSIAASGGTSTSGGGTVSSGGASGGAGGFGSGGVAGIGGVAGAYGGFGGSGAAIFDCMALTEVPPRQTVDHPGVSEDRNPKIVRAGWTQDYATVMFTRHSAPSDPTVLTHAMFEDWPASAKIAPTFQTLSSSDLTDDFRVAGGLGGYFAAVVRYSVASAPNSGILSFLPSIHAASSAFIPPIVLSGTKPAFVSLFDGNEYFVAVAEPAALHAQTYIANKPSGSVVSLGCANSTVGDAVRGDMEWLVAYSNTSNAPTEGCAGVDLGDATRIDIARVPFDGKIQHQLSFDVGAPIEGLLVAPHSYGLWIVYRTDEGNGVTPIRWMLVSFDTAKPVVGSGEISAPTIATLPGFDADTVASDSGQNLMVAWANESSGKPARITLTGIAANGDFIDEKSIDAPFVGEFSLVTRFHDVVSSSAYPPQVLVAWSEPIGSADSVVRVARFDCISGM